MKNYTVRKYVPEDYSKWNAFISKAKNATFLFHRDFMEYHQDRFQDFSLVILKDQNWVGVIPANRVEDTVFSHQGLTYGGLVINEKIKLGEVIDISKDVFKYLYDGNIKTFQIKLMPSMYQIYFSEEINYMLFLANAKLIRRDSLSVIDLTKPYTIIKSRRQSIRRSEVNNLEIKEEPEFDLFWNKILMPNLEKKHKVKPVHSLEEIKKLHLLFPEKIRHFNVYYEGEIVAGTTVFVTQNVAHPQYISGNEDKNELGSLDVLYHHLIATVFKDKNFFDFGISNEQQGKKINKGLLFWKESFGAKTTVQDFYEVETANYSLLENILI